MTSDLSSHDLMTSDRVNGTPVFSLAGERIGHVCNLSIDKVSGQGLGDLTGLSFLFGLPEKASRACGSGASDLSGHPGYLGGRPYRRVRPEADRDVR